MAEPIRTIILRLVDLDADGARNFASRIKDAVDDGSLAIREAGDLVLQKRLENVDRGEGGSQVDECDRPDGTDKKSGDDKGDGIGAFSLDWLEHFESPLARGLIEVIEIRRRAPDAEAAE